MDAKGYLNVNDLRKIWKEEFLPSIKRELKSELEALSTCWRDIEISVLYIGKVRVCSTSIVNIDLSLNSAKETR